MAHRCVKCGKIHESTSPVILKGCECGSHYFFFFKKEDIQAERQMDNLTTEDREEILKDVQEMVGPDVEQPVVLNLESIRVNHPGQYEVDLVSMFKRKPVIYKLEEGKYIIDLASTFQLKNQEKD
ncbi:MAG: Zn-ribbon containing protein [archaeon]